MFYTKKINKFLFLLFSLLLVCSCRCYNVKDENSVNGDWNGVLVCPENIGPHFYESLDVIYSQDSCLFPQFDSLILSCYLRVNILDRSNLDSIKVKLLPGFDTDTNSWDMVTLFGCNEGDAMEDWVPLIWMNEFSMEPMDSPKYRSVLIELEKIIDLELEKHRFYIEKGDSWDMLAIQRDWAYLDMMDVRVIRKHICYDCYDCQEERNIQLSR